MEMAISDSVYPGWAGVVSWPSRDDLARRLNEHNDPDRTRTKYTAKNGPWRLVWAESHPTRVQAVRRERFIKSRRSAAWIRQHLLGGVPTDVGNGHRD